MPSLLSRLRNHLTRTPLFPVPGTVVVAVSGGPDSVALLDLLQQLAPEFGLALVVAHADHGIHAESGAVAAAVRQLAERWALPCEVGELALGPGATETIARRARYAWLGEVRQRHAAPYIAMAHHRDDQLETILLRLLRGSAPAGLAGMAARARGGLVRPLLPFTKAELAAYLAARELPSHDDPANRDPKHLRTWVRRTLVPLVTERLGARARDDVVRAGRAAALERRAWDRALEHLPELDLRRHTHGFDVARAVLGRYDAALSVALLRAAARRAGLVLGMRRARALVRLAQRPSGRRLSLGGGWVAEVGFDRLAVARSVADALEPVAATAERGSALFGTYRVDWTPERAPTRLTRDDWTTWIEAGDWEIRFPRAGERLVPLGAVGHRRVRRLLMEARVPRSDRASYPVVARGETILWVPGICRSAAELPQPGTRAVRLDVTRYGEPQADRRT
jgi:tRNA(Ile)-lysidine synthase